MRRTGLRRGLALTLFLVMLALLLRLGFWQLERAGIKEETLQQQATAAALPPQPLSRLMHESDAARWHFAKAQARGSFRPARQYLLDNRTRQGKAGYEVLTPFSTSAGTVLVNRGWVPVGPDRRTLPSIDVSESPTHIDGVVSPPPRPGLLLGEDGYDQTGWPRVVQTVDLERMAQQLGGPLWAAVLRLDAAHPACLHCVWPTVGGVTPQRHHGYAVQWFALAIALVVLMGIVVWMEYRRERN